MTADLTTIENVFPRLAPLTRWVPYIMSWNADRGKFDKIPNNGLRGLSHSRPDDWSNLNIALTTATRMNLAGVGLVMTDGITYDGYRLLGIDLDDVTDNAFALSLRSYCEVSPSGKGLRLFVWVPEAWVKKYKDNTDAKLPGCEHSELYLGSAGRFLTVTFKPIVNKGIRRLGEKDLTLLEPYMKKPEAQIPITQFTDLGTPVDTSGFRLTTEQKDLLAGRVPAGSRSELVHSLLLALLEQGAPREDVYATVLNNDALLAYCLSHRHDDPERAAHFALEEVDRAWARTTRARQAALSKFNQNWSPVEQTPVEATPDPIEAEPLVIPWTGKNAFPEHLYSKAPGLVAEVARWVMKTVHAPREEFAYAAALACVSSFIGPNTLLDDGTPCNLYLVMIGGTGTGKTEAIDAIKVLMSKTLARDCLHDFPASEAGLRRQLTLTPNMLLYADELAHMLDAMKDNANGSTLGRAILEAYTGGRIPPKAYADERRCLPAVDHPYVQILGGTTGKIWDVFRTAHLDDGTLNRFMFVSLPDNSDYRFNPAARIEVPEDLKLRLDELWQTSIGNALPGGNIYKIDIEQSVKDRMAELSREAFEQGKQEFGNLWNRFALNSIKVAGVLAISDGQKTITMKHFEMGEAFVRWSITNTHKQLENYISGSTFEGLQKRLLRKLDKDGGVLSMRDAYKHLHLKRREMDELVDSLLMTGVIEIFEGEKAIKGWTPSYIKRV